MPLIDMDIDDYEEMVAESAEKESGRQRTPMCSTEKKPLFFCVVGEPVAWIHKEVSWE